MPRAKGITIQESDVLVLRFIGQQYGASFDLLKCLLRRSRPYNQGEDYRKNTYRSMKRWKELGLVGYEHLRGKTWIWVTTKGMKYVGLDYPSSPLPLNQLNHIEKVAMVRFFLECRIDQLEWIPPREYKYRYPNLKYWPDGIVIYDGEEIPQEVELSVKNIADKLSYYESRFPACWYWSSPTVHAYLTARESVSSTPIGEVVAWVENYRRCILQNIQKIRWFGQCTLKVAGYGFLSNLMEKVLFSA